MDKKASTFTYKETVVHFADYKPIETTKSEKEYNVEQPFEKNNHTNTQKKPDVSSLPLFKRSGNYDWREDIGKKFIKYEKKIINHKIKPLKVSPSFVSSNQASSDITPELENFLSIWTNVIKNHWYIPEDYYTQLQGASAEVSIILDKNGKIIYQVERSSQNRIFDHYFTEALNKTLTNFPYNNDIIDYLSKGGKIILEFKL